MSLKRNCTGRMELTIEEALEKIEAVELIFKPKPEHTAETLLRLNYDEENMPVKNGTDTSESTTLDIKLKPSETFKLVCGTNYMDVRIVCKDSDIPITGMVVIDGVEESLFEEVYDYENKRE